MKFQKFEISFLIFGSILVVLFNVILVALKVLVVFEIFKETSNKSAVKFLSSRTVYSNKRRPLHSFRTKLNYTKSIKKEVFYLKNKRKI